MIKFVGYNYLIYIYWHYVNLFFRLMKFFLINPILLNFRVFSVIFYAKQRTKNYFSGLLLTFSSCNSFFDILLVFVFFLRTYSDTYSFHILSYFFLLQISFCIYLSPVTLISLYFFYSNLLLYSALRFFYKLNQWSHSFLYITKKICEKNL